MAEKEKEEKTVKKTATKKAVTPKKENKKTEEQIKIEELENTVRQMKELMQHMSNGTTTQITETENLNSTKIKVMSLVAGELNLTTHSKGKGRIYNFPKYGYIHHIKYDDLEMIVHNHRPSLEQGKFYIMSESAIKSLCLEDEYGEIANKNTIDIIVELKDDTAVEMFTTLNEKIKIDVVDNIVDKILKGKEYNIYLLDKIKYECGIDINEKVKRIKLAEEIQNTTK